MRDFLRWCFVYGLDRPREVRTTGRRPEAIEPQFLEILEPARGSSIGTGIWLVTFPFRVTGM